MTTTAWQANTYTLGLIDGVKDGSMDGDMEGSADGRPETHVDRPDAAQAGYTQAGVEAKGSLPKELIPAQFSMMTTSNVEQKPNALSPIDVTLLGILTEVRELQSKNA